jgi:hypothetical protein
VALMTEGGIHGRPLFAVPKQVGADNKHLTYVRRMGTPWPQAC